MKNIAFDHGGTIQLDAICMDGPLDLSTDGQLFRDYCVSAWNKDPVFGVIGIQSGPRH